VTSDEAFGLIYLENRQLVIALRKQPSLDEVCALAAPRFRAAVAMRGRRRAEALEQADSQSDGILTADSGMTRLFETVHPIAITDLPVLIGGETGTGKGGAGSRRYSLRH
jgi:transcriptional regulator with GAF, ATPase, and Fis domain